MLGSLELAAKIPGAWRVLASLFRYQDSSLEISVAGLRFPNPVGLAAGFDKNCRLAAILPALGFGFMELGTVTPRPQAGNPKPRIFRVPEARALINRLGFNNDGAAAAAERLKGLGPHWVPIGVNIGINAGTAPDRAPAEYAKVFSELYLYGDYFAVNVSSPNTPGLRRLQGKLWLARILESLKKINTERKPVFVKLAPDLDEEELAQTLEAVERGASGVICTNTTLSRPDLDPQTALTSGGLSGEPLRPLSTEMIRRVHELSEGRLPIIGVGGVFSAEDAYEKIRAGASLIQIYTGLVYRGPGLPAEINRGLKGLLAEHGFQRISQAVGHGRLKVRK